MMRITRTAGLLLTIILSLVGCGQSEADVIEANPSSVNEEISVMDTQAEKVEETDTLTTENGTVLVAYFSVTDTTEAIAETVTEILGADLYEIVPEDVYTTADIDYNTDCRANREQNDDFSRPAIAGSIVDFSQYDTVILGYPIWHGQAPRIISTFLESYDFTGKTIVPFCTSHSSGIGSSDTNLHALAADANWLSGRRFAGGTSADTVEEWISSLDLPMENEALW